MTEDKLNKNLWRGPWQCLKNSLKIYKWEKQISYSNCWTICWTYLMNISDTFPIRYWWTYLQGSNWDTDIRTDLWTWRGEGEGGMNWESSIKTHILPYVKLDNQWKFVVWCRELKSGAPWQPRGVGWGGREVQEGGDRHVPMADSCWYLAETHTIS